MMDPAEYVSYSYLMMETQRSGFLTKSERMENVLHSVGLKVILFEKVYLFVFSSSNHNNKRHAMSLPSH
jgi:hypothetical protein